MKTTTIPKKVEEEEEVRFSILSSILFSFCVSLSLFLVDDFENDSREAREKVPGVLSRRRNEEREERKRRK
jgi:hypothetical protein